MPWWSTTARSTGGWRAWRSSSAAPRPSSPSPARLLDATEEGPGQWLVTNHLEGDFPGGVVDLNYRFRLVDDRIAVLVIAP